MPPTEYLPWGHTSVSHTYDPVPPESSTPWLAHSLRSYPPQQFAL
jgi:hypothetical protein